MNSTKQATRLHLDLRAQRLRERGMDPEQRACARPPRVRQSRRGGDRPVPVGLGLDRVGTPGAGCAVRLPRAAQDARLHRGSGGNPGRRAGNEYAVFSIVNAVMLRSLPYRQPDRLVSLWEEATKRQEVRTLNSSGSDLGGAGGRSGRLWRPRIWWTIARARVRSKAWRAWRMRGMNLTGDGSPERLAGERVTAEYFSVLGVAPEIGRTFTVEEDSRAPTPWPSSATSFGSGGWAETRAVLGRSLMLDARAYQVIGVMPRVSSRSPGSARPTRRNFWSRRHIPRNSWPSCGDHEINVVGRLKPGVSAADRAGAAHRRYPGVAAAVSKQQSRHARADRAVARRSGAKR